MGLAMWIGMGMAPAMALPIELRPDMPVKLFRFAAPSPNRSIGLAWRKSSPRRRDFEALGAILSEVGAGLAEADGRYPIEPQAVRLR